MMASSILWPKRLRSYWSSSSSVIEIAQLVERLNNSQNVEGSIPSF